MCIVHSFVVNLRLECSKYRPTSRGFHEMTENATCDARLAT